MLVVACLLLLGSAGLSLAGGFRHGDGGEPAGVELSTTADEGGQKSQDADNVGQESSKQGDDSEDAAVGDSDDGSGQESSKPSSDDDQSAEDDSGGTKVAPITP